MKQCKNCGQGMLQTAHTKTHTLKIAKASSCILQVIDSKAVFDSRKWWNWQTHHLEGVAPQGVGVQIPPSAPEISANRISGPLALGSGIENQK
jgi:hypothetical protein